MKIRIVNLNLELKCGGAGNWAPGQLPPASLSNSTSRQPFLHVVNNLIYHAKNDNRLVNNKQSKACRKKL